MPRLSNEQIVQNIQKYQNRKGKPPTKRAWDADPESIPHSDTRVTGTLGLEPRLEA